MAQASLQTNSSGVAGMEMPESLERVAQLKLNQEVSSAKPSKLADADVRNIRKSKLSQNELARKFGVSLAYINDIIHRRRRVRVSNGK